ncbi:MAG TPA: molybdenum cofactor guanylyltransferase [Terriglobales bacterium]|nr:molybdenum cofactor guanylyltransferase [Terriglobales bacterium]
MYDRCVENVTAFILAGGKSSRMGADKAFLELGGRTLLVRALEVVGKVTPQVRVLGDKNKFAAFGTVVEDVYPECGPLGGIHSALMSSATDFNLMLAVDLPFIGPEFLRYLISEAESSKAVVTVPRSGGVFQPLCAVYRKKFWEVAERALRARKNKIGALFGEVKTHVLEETDLSKAGFGTGIFRNLNTPAEWEEAKVEFEKKS